MDYELSKNKRYLKRGRVSFQIRESEEGYCKHLSNKLTYKSMNGVIR